MLSASAGKLTRVTMPFRSLPLLMLLAAVILPSQTVPVPIPSSQNDAGTSGTQDGSKDPVLHNRPAKPAIAVPKPNRSQLDVVVTDAEGKPVPGLQPWDFKLLDNDRPSKILYHRAYGAALQPDPPVEVILVLDLMNLSLQQAAFARDQLSRFLQQNGGKLAQPVTLMVLTDKDLAVQPRPSRDGNTVSAVLKSVSPRVSAINSATGIQGAIERFNRSLRQISLIAENETHKPGRKLLVWIGTGWPMLETQNYLPSEGDRSKYFEAIVQLSSWLREARIAVYSVAPIEPGSGLSGRAILYQSHLKPVLEPKKAQSGDLALRVLAMQTGGLVLGPSNDLVGQIQQCVADANNFYQLTFEPAHAERADEYHALRVVLNQPGLTVRTNTGYYAQPSAH